MIFSFSDSTSLYFYSALLQGNAALIALVAVFLIYRKQYLNSLFDRIESIIINYLTKAASVSVNYGNIFDLQSYNEKIFQNMNDQSKTKVKEAMNNITWIARFAELQSINNQRNSLWSNATWPITSIFAILIGNAIMLPLSDLLHSFIWLEASLFLVFVTCEIITLVSLYKFIRNQLR